MTTGMRRAAATAMAAVLVLGACSGDDSSSDAPNTTIESADNEPAEGVETEETTPTTTLAPSTVISVAVQPGVSEGFDGARADIGALTCELEDGRWAVSGDVTNPLDVPASYRIYTSFLDGNRTTLGLLEVNADEVAPGETREWSGTLDLAAPDLECVLRVERTRLES